MKALSIFLMIVGLLFIAQSADPVDCWDNDNDGYEDCECAPDPCDCDDEHDTANPGIHAEWEPPFGCDDGIDNDCDGLIDFPWDPDYPGQCFLGSVL